MAATATITKVVASEQDCTIYFNVALSGSYVAGGDTVNLVTAAQDAAFVGLVATVPSSTAPLSFAIWDAGGNIVNSVTPVKGTTPANGKVKFSAASTFGTEFSAGAYSAALLSATLQGMAVFNKYV